jgi:hypothetical protein
MKLPPWAIPAIVIAYLGLRIAFAFRPRRATPGVPEKTWFQTVPVWIRIFWGLLALAMVGLAFWSPVRSRSGNPADPGPPVGLTYSMTDEQILRAMKLDPQLLTHQVTPGADGEENDYRDAINWVAISRSRDTLSVLRLAPKDKVQNFLVHR